MSKIQSTDSPEKWEKLSSEEVARARVFSLRVARMRRPITVAQKAAGETEKKEDDYYTIESPDWSNIIAFTEELEVVLVEQFRHGVEEITLEVPGGILDPEENPEEAVIRELREETGFSVQQVKSLGWVHPNPALMANKCHLFIGTGARLTTATDMDEDEDIRVRLEPLEQVVKCIQDQTFTHALMIAGFFRLFASEEISSECFSDEQLAHVRSIFKHL